MSKLGLALSGGGFRATLFHLGVIRFLRDVDELRNVTDIASVSGGSILAAHLVLNWDRYGGNDASFASAASEIVKFVQFDVRNHIVRRLPPQLPLRFLAKLLFRSGRNLTPNAILERYYRRRLYGDRRLYELPEQPMLHMLATSVSSGALSVFNRNGLYMQERTDNGVVFKHTPGQMASIPQVVGASSAFPGFFPPVQITAADLGVRDGQFPTESFTDGGVYDNLGIRAFSWLKQQNACFDKVLASDAGKPFQILEDPSLGLISQSVRASDILWDRVWQLERENFGNQEGFVFLPISDSVDLAEDPTALHPVVQAEVQTIRTDLDYFSGEEINALVHHGYEVARKVFRSQKIIDEEKIPVGPPWLPIADTKISTPDAVGSLTRDASAATQMSTHLRQSSRRRYWSTLLDWRDWPSYVYVAIACFLLIYLPLQVYQLYKKSQTQGAVINSIASGDPDIRQILNLTLSDPLENWTPETIQEKQEPEGAIDENVEILTHSRILDLRQWHPKEDLESEQGKVYIRDRIILQLNRSYTGDGRVIFQFPTRLENVEFRQPRESIQGIISQIKEPIIKYGKEHNLYEIEYDLSEIPLEEPVKMEIEAVAKIPKTARAPFYIRRETDLITVWILFPPDMPYRTYNLVSYPRDRSEPAKIMNVRYTIDHPYGSLIGWSVVNPQVNHVYECRWTN